MTTITGTIGNSFTGKLGVWFYGNVTNELTTPKTVYLKGESQEKFYSITAGVVNAVVPQTELDNISAHFSVYATDSGGVIIRPAIDEFDAIVLNVSSMEFNDLIPTGVVNSQLDTAALRIARIIASDPVLASKVAGAPYPRGAYSNTETYNYGEMVSYFGKNYISKSTSSIIGILPTNTTKWYELVITLSDNVAVVATADNSPFSASWNNSLLAASQNAIYDRLQALIDNVNIAIDNITTLQNTKANLSGGATFTDVIIVPDLSLGDNSSKSANTKYVDFGLNQKANAASMASALGLKANKVGDTLTDPFCNTPPNNSNSGRISTTAFVHSVLDNFQNDSLNKNYWKISGTNFMIKCFSENVTVSGEFASVFYNGSPAFVGGVLTVIVSNGNAALFSGGCAVQSFDIAGFVLRVPGYSSGTYRVNWVAIGFATP